MRWVVALRQGESDRAAVRSLLARCKRPARHRFRRWRPRLKRCPFTSVGRRPGSVTPVDWDAFETAWHDSGCRTLAGLVTSHPGERLYAAAFNLFYADGKKILPPALAANTEIAVRHVHAYSR